MKATATAAACALLLTCGAAFAAPTAQQKCDYARITAWKKYSACIENVVAKDAKGYFVLHGDLFASFARCRHTYFGRWTTFQRNAALAASTCIGSRFVDNGDQTVTDNLSGLVWEKKDELGGIHDRGASYTWTTGAPYRENGTAFTAFLANLNGGGGFAGANGWRLPTLSELQSILFDFECKGPGGDPRCTCSIDPCIDPTFGATQSGDDWSITAYAGDIKQAWYVSFSDEDVLPTFRANSGFVVRAVSGGL